MKRSTDTPLVRNSERTSLRLEAVTAVAPEVLVRVLQLFQGRNIVPQRVTAQRTIVRGSDLQVLKLEVEFAVADISVDALRLITAKIQQWPITLSAVLAK